jgi:hypothetical protein
VTARGVRECVAYLASAALLLSACDGWVSVHGEVTDVEGQPVAGVLVQVTGHGLPDSGRTLVSDEFGRFRIFEAVPPSSVPTSLAVALPGYKALTAVVPNEAPLPARVVLRLARMEETNPSEALMYLWSGKPGHR